MTIERKVDIVYSRVTGEKLDKPATLFEKYWCSRYSVRKNEEGLTRGMLIKYIKAVDFGCTQTYGRYNYDKLFSRLYVNMSEENEKWTHLTGFVIECICILLLCTAFKALFSNFLILIFTFIFVLVAFLVGSRKAFCIYPFIMVLVYFLMFNGVI